MAQPAQNTFQALGHTLGHALAAAVSSAGPSVVQVHRGHGHTGTGIAWADDLVITSNFHVPDRTQIGVAVRGPSVDGSSGEAATAARELAPSIELREAEVIGRDPGSDVALVRVTGGGLAPARFRDLDDLAVGHLALALGRPGRTVRASLRAIGVLGPAIRTPHGGTLEHYVESDRQIPRGFAGGPLVDPDGWVIGMNTRTLLRGEDLAVPTATLRRVVAELAAHGGVRRGYLGVAAFPAELPSQLAQQLGADRGALVASVEDGGPAAAAGLLVGDIIIELAGAAVRDPAALRLALGDRPGQTVEIVLVRGGARHAVSVVLGSQP